MSLKKIIESCKVICKLSVDSCGVCWDHLVAQELHFKKKSRNTKFVWLMGSDNLIYFHNWINAQEISKISMVL